MKVRWWVGVNAWFLFLDDIYRGAVWVTTPQTQHYGGRYQCYVKEKVVGFDSLDEARNAKIAEETK